MEQRWAQAISEVVDDQATPRFRFLVRGESMLPTFRPGDEAVVERVTLDQLCPGDIVLVQNQGQKRLHRFLGVRRREGRCFLITAGDHRRRTDAPLPEQALVGRVVTAYRAGQVLEPSRGRWQAWRHRARTALWAAAYRIRKALPLLALLSLLVVAPNHSQASVTLISFEAKWSGDKVQVTWETGSEVDALGFYIHRSEQAGGGYEQRTDLIPSEGDIIGAYYEWEDRNVEPGKTYYYKLEDVSASGPSKFWGPVSAASEQPTATFTPTLTATPRPSVTPSSTATPSPSPSATATKSPTPTLSPTPTRTPVPSASPTPTPRATWTATPTRRPSATPSAATALALPSATTLPGQLPAPTLMPEVLPPTSTAAISVPAQLSPTTSATLVPAAGDTRQPAPTATPAVVAAEGPPESAVADAVSDEELAQAQRRLSWTLIGIGGLIISGLLLVMVGLVAYALYRWGLLRYG